MGCNVCPECTRKCQFLHGKGKSASLFPTSFFKIMLGDDFSQYMYVPPKFSRTVPARDLLNKKIILEDSRGEQWKVTISFLDGSVAFKEGWSAFSLDHGLKIGDFLIFNYTSESHFDVWIYDESACNKLAFSKRRNQKKRSRDRNGSSVKDGLLVRQGLKASVVSMPDVPKMKRQHREVDLGGTQINTEKISNYGNINGRAQSVCIEDYHEDPCYMTSRGLGETERDDKTSTFDVLDCEILNNCGVNVTRKVATVDSNVSHVDYGSHVCNKDHLFKRILGRGAASDPSELELSARNHSLEQKNSSAYYKNCTLKLKENSERISIMSNREVRECQFTEGLGEMLKITEKKHVDNYMTPNDCTPMWTGQMSKGIKKEHVNMIPSVYKELPATGEMSKWLRSELEDMAANMYKDEFLLATGKLRRETASDPYEFELTRRNHSLGRDKGAYETNCTMKLEKNRENNSIMSNRKVQEYQFAEGLESEKVMISQKTHASHIDSFYNINQIFNGIPNISDTMNIGVSSQCEMLKMTEKKHMDMTPNVCSFEDKLHATGPMSKVIKKEIVDEIITNMCKDELPATGETSKRIKSELQDMTTSVYKDELLLATGSSKVIKRELGQSSQPFNEDSESHSQTAATVSCVVPIDDDNFLELPAPLSLSNKRGMKMKRLVVYLRDQLTRLWPVFYHERSNFCALTEGWSEYRKANNIQPTDVCIFRAENKSNRIIVVDIVPK